MPVSSAVSGSAKKLLKAAMGAKPVTMQDGHVGTGVGAEFSVGKDSGIVTSIEQVNEMNDEWRFANTELIKKLAAEAGWSVAEDFSVFSPERAAEFYGGKPIAAAKGKGPAELSPDEDSMVLVGDGGKDPAAEEYVYLPAGSGAIIAPKMDPKEKPSMSNAVMAIANTALKGKLKKAAVGATGTIGVDVFPQYDSRGKVLAFGPNPMEYPRPASTAAPMATASAAPRSPIVIPGTSPMPTTQPYDVGVEQDASRALMDTLGSLTTNPVVDGQGNFGKRPGISFAQARNGARKLLGKKLDRAQYGSTKKPVLSPGGMVVGYTSQAVPSAQGMGGMPANKMFPSATTSLADKPIPINPNSTAQNAVQRAIAQMQVDANMRIAEMTNRTNMERLALDRLLGQQQLDIDRMSAAEQAQQLLMTRAGRQLVAPGGNVIPSMQPSLGRSIN